MTMSDPISDLLTRIRNALSTGKPTLMVPASKMKASLLDVLVAGGEVLCQVY